MKRLLQSSGFWNALTATILMGVACKVGCSDMIEYIFFLFAGKQVVSGAKDFVRAKNNVQFDPESKKFTKVE